MRVAAFFRALSGIKAIFEPPEGRCISKEKFLAPVCRLNTATYVADERCGHAIYRPKHRSSPSNAINEVMLRVKAETAAVAIRVSLRSRGDRGLSSPIRSLPHRRPSAFDRTLIKWLRHGFWDQKRRPNPRVISGLPHLSA